MDAEKKMKMLPVYKYIYIFVNLYIVTGTIPNVDAKLTLFWHLSQQCCNIAFPSEESGIKESCFKPNLL